MVVSLKNVVQNVDLRVKELMENHLRVSPVLTCLYSNDAAAQSFVQAIQTRADYFKIEVKAKEVSADQWEKKISTGNADWNTHGLLLISPPKKLSNPNSLIVDYKNVEGNEYDDRLDRVSCTARACLLAIQHSFKQIEGCSVAILGFGKAVGKPLSYLLMRNHVGNISIIHKYSDPLEARKILVNSDIIVSATGHKGAIRIAPPGQIYYWPTHIKNKVIIDAGICEENDRITGEVPYEYQKYNKVTPVPGGVGSITTSLILENTVLAARGEL